MAPAASTAARAVGPCSLLRRANFISPSLKRPAQPEPACAPRAERAPTLDSPLAMLPPGALSASGSSIAPPPGLQSLTEGTSTQSSYSELTAPALGLEEDFEPTAAELEAFLADEEVMLEMQSVPDILGSTTPARASPEMVADVRVQRQRLVVAYRVQEAVESAPTPGRREMWGPGRLNEMFNEIDGMTRGQQALHRARQRMQTSSTDVEIVQAVDKLALALGATRTQARTRKALLAVLDLLNRPEMSEQEVCASTGASFQNFKRWQRRVLNVQAGLPPQAYTAM